ncbi:hypothetical protein OROHE_008951 [Orobanche hederae]
MAMKKANGFPEGDNLPDELLKLLQSLASNWGDAFDLKTLKIVHLTGAMTNEIYRISWPRTDHIQGAARIVLVRMYGQGVEHFFERDDEIRTFECVSVYGHGPKLLGRFEEGRVEEFIHARTLSAADLRHPETSALIAAKLREFHNLDMPGRKDVVLWNRLRKWLNVAKDLCPHEHAKQYKLDSLDREIGLMEKAISRRGQEIGFCHNDLQYGDYEYASYNPVAYDIANHFCEMAADYHTDTPHILDYSKYPDWEERQRFMKQYLTHEGKEPTETTIDQLEDDVKKYALANHVFWGLWGVISAYVNQIDFDYMEYARQRFEQYWLRKSEVLNV